MTIDKAFGISSRNDNRITWVRRACYRTAKHNFLQSKDLIVTAIAVESIVALIAHDDVVAGAAINCVVERPAVQFIVARSAVYCQCCLKCSILIVAELDAPFFRTNTSWKQITRVGMERVVASLQFNLRRFDVFGLIEQVLSQVDVWTVGIEREPL